MSENNNPQKTIAMTSEEAKAVEQMLSGFTLIERDNCFQFWNKESTVSLFISKMPDVLFEDLVALSYESANSSDRWKTLIKPNAESVRSTLLSFRYERLLKSESQPRV